jgi:hypothetical protein
LTAVAAAGKVRRNHALLLWFLAFRSVIAQFSAVVELAAEALR